MLDQEKREAERKTAQSRNIEEQSVEAGKTAAGENGKGAEMQKEEPAEKNDQEMSVAASEQEKTGKKRKKKAKQAETAKDLPETVMPPKKRKKKIKKWMIVAAIIVILLVVNIATKLLRPASLPALAGSYAQTGDVEQTLDTSGYVSSEVEETVFSPVTAYVSSSVLEEGQPVTAGEKVVELSLIHILTSSDAPRIPAKMPLKTQQKITTVIRSVAVPLTMDSKHSCGSLASKTLSATPMAAIKEKLSNPA